jgi:hypothetical protein
MRRKGVPEWRSRYKPAMWGVRLGGGAKMEAE